MKINSLTQPVFSRLILACAAAALMLLSAQAQTKIGLIDFEKVFHNFWKKKQADALLKERQAEFVKQRKGMIDDYQKANEEYKKLNESAGDQAVSSEEREKHKTAAEKKLVEVKGIEQEISQYDRNSGEALGAQMGRLREKILEEMRELINAKAKAAGCTMVLDTSGKTVNQTPAVLYHNGQNDLTEEVLAQLNANAPATATEPDESEDKTAKRPGQKKEDKK